MDKNLYIDVIYLFKIGTSSLIINIYIEICINNYQKKIKSLIN
jgi:hypothetical protein